MGPHVTAMSGAATSHASHLISLTDDERLTLLEEKPIKIIPTFSYVGTLVTCHPTAELFMLMSTS